MEISKEPTLRFKALNITNITEHIIILSIIIIVMEFSKVHILNYPAVQSTEPDKHNRTHNYNVHCDRDCYMMQSGCCVLHLWCM